jgi:indole-3-glycerol phosphate synthase
VPASWLDRIVRDRKEALEEDRRRLPPREARDRAEEAPPPRGLGRALAEAPGLSVIAEVKRASPSAGPIRPDVDPAEWAARYRDGGAAALSVLTEARHFRGSLDDLRRVRAAIDLPVLRKDFLLDPYQIWESRAAEADAVLLIVAMLERPLMTDLLALTLELGMDPLIEVHDEAELDRALEAGASLIGINNRDLLTFEVSLAVTERLAPRVPAGGGVVSESGVSGPEEAARAARAGVEAILVGEALMRADDPADLIGALVKAGR